jgi:hypothetical protein
MAQEPTLRRNGQVVQPNVEQMPEGNGWPTPLTDESNPVQMKVQDGKNGESIMNDGINTSQTKTGGWSLTEGSAPASATQPNTQGDEAVRSGDPLKTSQQIAGEHHLPESD